MKINAITLLRGSIVLANQIGRQVQSGIFGHVMVAPHGFQWANVNHRPAFESPAKPGTLGHSQAKCDHIVALYNEFLPALCDEGDAVLIWEDDITPPVGGLSKLTLALQGLPYDVGAVVSVYPQHGDPAKACLWGRQYDESLSIANLPGFPFEVFRGGTGFALFRSEALRSALPLTRDAEGVDWCQPLARRLSENGWKTYCHGAVRCEHAEI